MGQRPKVSIMMPAYNVGQFIDQTMASVMGQTYENWELCFVDDCSEDDTWERICQYQDPRIKRRRLAAHSHCPVARNTCLEMMTGEIVGRLDADDWQDPERFELETEALLADASIALVVCRMYAVHEDGSVKLLGNGPLDAERYVCGNGGAPANTTIFAWREVYDKVGGFNVRQLAGSDGDWNFRVIRAGYRWGFVDRPLYYYRLHPAQISRTLGHMQRATRATNIRLHGEWAAAGGGK